VLAAARRRLVDIAAETPEVEEGVDEEPGGIGVGEGVVLAGAERIWSSV
jgi:hypothetical protein